MCSIIVIFVVFQSTYFYICVYILFIHIYKCLLPGSNYQSVNERLKSESKWVIKLSTPLRGLKKDLGILSDFPCVIKNPAQASCQD